jgi:dihydrofolate reductase
VILVGAMTADRVIGRGGGMPWDVPEEYAHFLRLVDGQTIIIGRRSYEIFGPTLTGTRNVVVTRSARELPGAVVAASVEEAVRTAASFGRTVFSAGGASIYAQTLPLADAMYLSFIKGDFGRFAGDAYFPPFSADEWAVERREDHPRFEFVVYRRRAPSGRGSPEPPIRADARSMGGGRAGGGA